MASVVVYVRKIKKKLHYRNRSWNFCLLSPSLYSLSLTGGETGVGWGDAINRV